MPRPIDPRLLRRGRETSHYLIAAVGVGAAIAGLTIVQAWTLAHSLGDIFATRTLATLDWAVPILIAVFVGRAVLVWLNQWLAQRTAAAVKSRLRRDVLVGRLSRPVDPGTSSAGLVTLITQGLDALDGYYSKYLPQLVLAVTVPLIIGVAILTADLTSALIVALTVPLIPVFMALVGWTTEALTRKRWRLQNRLANHFADLVAGLPTLQVFGRARAQAEGLRRTEAAHRSETMRTLRVSFLSALVLELLSTLSVAIVAVTVGFRVVYWQLDLTTALFVLILAPEVYLPVRQVGVHYHDAADGMAAAETAFAIIEGEPGPPVSWDAKGAAVRIEGLSHRYPGAESAAVEDLSFSVAPGRITVLTGPSGTGKTTVLNAVMGFLAPDAGKVAVAGDIAFVGQQPGMINGTVADNIRLGDPDAGDAAVRNALDRAGAPELPIDWGVGDEGEGLSAGERRRVAMARALLRIGRGASVLVLDEPTAGLDADAEAVLLGSLRSLGTATLAVSHRPAVIALADEVVTLNG